MEKARFLVFGAGAIGTYLGGSLALAGHRVTFLEQPAAVDKLNEDGLVLDLTLDHGAHTLHDPSTAIFRIPSEGHPALVEFVPSLEAAFNREPFDAVIYALKSFDTPAAGKAMKAYSGQFPPVLCMSNGVDNEPQLAALLGPDKVIAGTVTSSIGRRAVGDIQLERKRGIGVADGHPLSLFLAEALNAAGLNARLYPRPADMKWSKMLTNLPANATAAILDLTASEVFAHPGLFKLEMRMLREALSVMKALGVKVVNLPGVPVRALALGTILPELVSLPLMKKAVGGGRGAKMPSFHIDLHSGRGQSEIEWLNGAVARYGKELGVATPVNTLLTDTLLAMTCGEIPLATFSRKPDLLLKRIPS